jgi:hypothetical protein
MLKIFMFLLFRASDRLIAPKTPAYLLADHQVYKSLLERDRELSTSSYTADERF